MRISAKSRYGLFAVVEMASLYENGDFITLLSLAEKLNISKIYLEQVFSALKHNQLVISAKGAQGGYKLSRSPKDISVYEVLRALETALFERTEGTTSNDRSGIERAIQETVFMPLDESIKETLEVLNLESLVQAVDKLSSDEGYMYYL